MNKSKILAITGIRSEYDILYSALRSIDEHKNLELHLVVTGAHCSEMFGHTVKQIEKDGFSICEKIESLLNSNSLGSRVKSLGIQMSCLVQTIQRIKPDIMLVAGDREEALNGAICASYMNIPVAHMCGGDYVVGNVDDSVRNAITKLSHLHFPMSLKSSVRIKRMGEESWRIHNVGSTGVDRLLSTPHIKPQTLSQKIGFDIQNKPIIVLIQHIISSEKQEAKNQMDITLNAVEKLGYTTVIIYPNSDAGSMDIIKAIENRLPKLPNAKAFRNLPRLEFVNILRNADVLIGNSSLGIIEAPTLNLPVINIGNRQKGREHSENVIFVPHDPEQIIKAIERALHDKKFINKVKKSKSPYGNGTAGKKIANFLYKVKLGNDLIIKK